MSARDRGESDLPSEKRMTLGEHLDELRGCVIRSIIALVLAALICIFPAKYLLAIIVRPLVLAMRANNQPDSLLATSPVETIVVYVKVVVLFAVVLAGPYVIYQIWHFVAVGLYPKEKAWVYRLFPTSLALFVTGVAFMYVFALLLALNFLVGFGTWLPLPQAHPTVFERTLLGTPAEHAPATVPDLTDWPDVPLVVDDPPESPVGTMWFNLEEKRLKVRTGDETYSYQFQRDDKRAMVTPHFKIGDYLSFVLVLTLAFGIAFQLPIVVVFLARTGIVPVATFRKYRKGVILLIVFIAGMLAPPDLLSHLLLSGPMVLLFEIGLRIADRQNRRQQAGNPRPKQPA
jgi:Sec-independent protein secretion pathway component TatC